MKNTVIFLVLLTLLPTVYAQRYALVIGNSNYSHVGRLKNPVNDATDMAAMLRKKQFSVSVLKNATYRQMKEAISTFTRQLNEKEAVGLFFFAGHGVEVDGRNYLIPVDANIQGEGDVEFESVDAGRVMNGMRIAGNNLNMVILDACRNNPYARSFRSASRGLSRMDPPKGSLILYATSPGDVAADGSGRNGLFTQHLLQAIDTPNLTVEKVFKTTANQVYRATATKQLPWQSGVMLGDFYFSGEASIQINAKPDSAAKKGNNNESVFWNIVSQKNTVGYYQAYLNKYGQNGLYYDFALLELKRLNANSTAEQAPQKAKLTVKTSPGNARVRILNIGPKYQNGIALKPGRYHIEASLAGYTRKTEWITLAAEDKVHSVVLTEIAQTPAIDNTSSGNPKPRHQSQQGIAMVRVNPGCFQMGVGSYETNHRVCLTQGYYIGKYEVTQAQWQSVMGNNPAYFKCAQCPVEQVSWNDVQDFMAKLNRQSGMQYRLPTEAEWEYACRSGGREQTYCGGNTIGSVAWYNDNSGSKTHSVGGKQANGLGLYDMSGNVWEWVSDWYAGDYYEQSQTNDPKGSSGGSYRVFRGGGWDDSASYARSAYRGHYAPEYRYVSLGFRLARTN